MKKTFFFVCITLLGPLKAQEVIREWNFNDQTKTAVGSSDSVRVIGEVTGVVKAASSGSKNYVLHTSSYAAKDKNNCTQGIEFATSTQGFTDISLSTTLKFSTTAANTWIIQACLGVSASEPEWYNIDTLGVFTKSGSNIQTQSNLSIYSFLNDKEHISFRIVAAFAIGETQYLPISATAYSTRGTVQFDNIILSGTKKETPSCDESEIVSSNIAISNKTAYSATLNWENGDGDSTLVLISEYPTLSSKPINGKAYQSSLCYGRIDSKIGNTYILSTSSENVLNIRNLRPNKKYYIYLFETYCNPIKYTSTPAEFNFTTSDKDENPKLFINELMADNSVTIKEDRNLYKDWIELYTSNAFPIDLTGYFISNDANNLIKCCLREKIPAIKSVKGFYTLLWADGTTNQNCTHLNFELRKDGGTIYITAPDSVTVIDSVSYPALTTDEAYQRNGDADNSWIKTKKATPSIANISQSVSIDVFDNYSFKIWPNPIKKGQTLYFVNLQDVKLYDSKGILILNKENIKEINTECLNRGLYLLQFKNGINKKVIIY